MITLFSCDFFYKFVSIILYPREVKMLKWAMLGAFTIYAESKPVVSAMI